jgi:RND superfamily putative drug exporter
LLEERLRLTSPWYLAAIARRRARIRAGRVSGALQGLDRQTVAVDASTRIESLPQLERAVALAAVALSERTPVVLLDALDPFSDARDARAFLLALDRLAPSATTVVVGMPGLSSIAEATPRRIKVQRIHTLDLSLVTEGAAR